MFHNKIRFKEYTINYETILRAIVFTRYLIYALSEK